MSADLIDGLSLLDRRHIDDLYIKYCWTLNEGDAEGWADCFAPTGVFVPAFGAVHGEFHGRERLVAFASDLHRNRATRHWNANIRPVRDGSVVRSACYCLLVDYAGPAPMLLTHAVYHDVLSPVEGEWRFMERRPAIDRAG